MLKYCVAGHWRGVCKGGRGEFATATEALQICLILPEKIAQIMKSNRSRSTHLSNRLKTLPTLLILIASTICPIVEVLQIAEARQIFNFGRKKVT